MKLISTVLATVLILFFCSFCFSVSYASTTNDGIVNVDQGKEKGAKKEKTEEKAEKNKGGSKKKVSNKPSKRSKLSARSAKQSISQTMKDINSRSKVRNYFHHQFNSKQGTVRNFRSGSGRRRWMKGR